MKIFFIAPFEGKKYYQKSIDKIIEIIESTGAEVLSPEKTREYQDVFREENIKKLGDKERVHYEFIRQGVINADAVVVEASHEDFRVGHEATLALLYKKPVLCLSQNVNYAKYISHENFNGFQYNDKNVRNIVLNFLSEVSKKILSKRSASLNVLDSRWRDIKTTPKKNVVTLGSITIDMVTKVQKIPKENDIIISEGLKLVPGGKATNAAIAISRLQENVFMIGKVGNDFFGEDVKSILNKDGVNTDFVDTDSFIPTGTIMVNVDERGKNTIVVNEDANIRINKKTISDFLQGVDNGLQIDCFYVTLEPLTEMVEFAIKEFKKRSVMVFLDAAPQARPLPEYLYRYIDFLSANEYEATTMTGIKVVDHKTANKAAKYLRKKGANHIIITLGKMGAILLKKNDKESTYFPGNIVKVVDETAAGDAFRGAFVAEYLETKDMDKAMVFANKAGAFAVTKLGAYSAMPTREELEFLEILK